MTGNGEQLRCPPHSFLEEDTGEIKSETQCDKCGMTYKETMEKVELDMMGIRAQLDKKAGKEN